MPYWKRNLYVCLFGSFATAMGLSLVLPFLPLYIETLGVTSQAAIVEWSGYAFGATFLLAAFVSPVWGRLADTYGRKSMLLRASLGMAIVMSLMGSVTNVYQLVGLRLLMGLVAGYVSAAYTLVATQTPKSHAGWALGTMSTGVVGGNLLGPLVGGWLAETLGLRHTFFVTGALLFCAFVITWCFVHEDFVRSAQQRVAFRDVWRSVAQPRIVGAMFVTAFMFQLANLSIEPIITVYIKQLIVGGAHVAVLAGAIVSAAAVASIVAAPPLGRVSDAIGAERVLLWCLVACALTLIPQAFVTTPWQLMALRFLMGLTLAGLIPGVSAVVKKHAPDSVIGRLFGYVQSAQYLGEIAGPVLGGHVAAAFGLRNVFFSTAALMLANAAINAYASNGAGAGVRRVDPV
jgi:MFS transporter, DHA1 family, multidrug resistance protein